MRIGNNSIILAKLADNYALVMKEKHVHGLSDNEQKAVNELKSRDKEVRLHEAEHMRNPELISVGGPKFTYAIGPDGKAYAIGGNVTLTTGKPKSPEDAMQKAMALKNSSMGVGEPSSKDIGASISAGAMFQEAFIKSRGITDISEIKPNNTDIRFKNYNEQKNLLSKPAGSSSTGINLLV